MRILFIGQKGIPARFGGIEYHVDELSRGLAARGHDVRVYVRDWYTDKKIKSADGVRLIHLPTIRSKHLDASIHSLLSSFHASFSGADIIHYQAIGPAFFSWIPRLLGKKVVCTVHRQDWKSEKWRPVARTFLKIAERASIRFPQRTIVVSRTLQEYFKKKYGKETIHITHGRFPTVRREPSLITVKYGLKGKDYILFLGRLVPEKRVDLVIRAYLKIKGTSPAVQNVLLIIAGGSSATDAYAQRLKDMSAQDPSIRFVGFVSGIEKEELLTNALVFVLPSCLEGFPIALLEAKSYGLCCLVSDISPHREAVRDGYDGLLFRAEDFSDLADKLLLALENEESLADLKKQACEETRRGVTWAEASEQTERVYKEILGSPA
jgi:glycosyltransferase involved in cell wall biosynthesis